MFSTPMAVVRTTRAGIAALIVMIALGFSVFDASHFAYTISASTMIAAVGGGVFLPMIVVAFPWNRKRDLLGILTGAIMLLTLGRYSAGGSPAVFADGAAALVGALMTYGATGTEKTRGRARKFGNVLFEVIEIEDRRVEKRRRKTLRTGGQTAIT
jgi:hypothetical protein